MVADQARIGDLEVRAASVVGTWHRTPDPAQPRQDDFRIGHDSSYRHLIVAVADGMSDSRHSDLAATVTCAALVNELRNQLDGGLGLAELDAVSAFTGAASHVAQTAHQRGWHHNDVRAVAIAAVVPTGTTSPGGSREAWLARVGDATAWRRHPAGWEPLTGISGGSGLRTGGLECFLPFTPEAAAASSVSLVAGDVLAITTDGFSDAIAGLPDAETRFAELWRSPVTAPELLRHIDFEARQHHDDRTAAVVWCPVGGECG
ncbi:protein phosphatase 2C domain-containing protein [Streptomonospora salina]|uniref:Serine/threonine protein phosphatase PrpC n=1 Tax=Streptomonospora salina TaxID=104205 RepID=A0A841EA43_9ACTN|nr:protein phosphatase 2C domain-containing protein [Streptomonospora salina]MBB5998169.1 serine/threonine protein phosphatase PrpC [Streptomonospora salina]